MRQVHNRGGQEREEGTGLPRLLLCSVRAQMAEGENGQKAEEA